MLRTDSMWLVGCRTKGMMIISGPDLAFQNFPKLPFFLDYTHDNMYFIQSYSSLINRENHHWSQWSEVRMIQKKRFKKRKFAMVLINSHTSQRHDIHDKCLPPRGNFVVNWPTNSACYRATVQQLIKSHLTMTIYYDLSQKKVSSSSQSHNTDFQMLSQ